MHAPSNLEPPLHLLLQAWLTACSGYAGQQKRLVLYEFELLPHTELFTHWIRVEVVS
jgi:hypothetical protein